jgi:PST family polysaccharide transporter
MAPEIVQLLLGPQWERTVPVLRILALASIFDSIAFFRGHVLMAMGKPSWRLWQSLASSVLHVIAFAVAYRWGIVAIAWAYLVRRAIMLPIGQWAVRLLIHFSWRRYLQQLIAPAAASSAMVVGVLVVKHALYGWGWSVLPLTAACIGIGVIAYGLAIRLAAPGLYHQLVELVHVVRLQSAATASTDLAGGSPNR